MQPFSLILTSSLSSSIATLSNLLLECVRNWYHPLWCFLFLINIGQSYALSVPLCPGVAFQSVNWILSLKNLVALSKSFSVLRRIFKVNPSMLWLLNSSEFVCLLLKMGSVFFHSKWWVCIFKFHTICVEKYPSKCEISHSHAECFNIIFLWNMMHWGAQRWQRSVGASMDPTVVFFTVYKWSNKQLKHWAWCFPALQVDLEDGSRRCLEMLHKYLSDPMASYPKNWTENYTIHREEYFAVCSSVWLVSHYI